MKVLSELPLCSVLLLINVQGKPTLLFIFSTFTLPFFTELHSKGYRKVDGKNVKVLPENIAELLTPRAWPIASREKVVMIKVEEQYG
jgi:hypothetical protein